MRLAVAYLKQSINSERLQTSHCLTSLSAVEMARGRFETLIRFHQHKRND